MPAILTIHDPLKPTARPVGIDLGTTNSLVAWVDHCAPKTIAVEGASALLPSVVHYSADCTVVVGERAKDLASDHPRDTIVSVKRFMGRGGDDEETRRMGPYDLCPGGSVVRFRVTGREVTPVEVSAEILRVLKARAEEHLGSPVTQAVVTVPAYFDDAQRQATRDAGRLAGLEVLRLLNEPTAAALAYGLDKESPERRPNGMFAVFDLGGGTFDVTILVLDDGVFQVKSTGGDTALGGDDMDRAIAQHLFDRLGVSPDGASPSLTRRALDAARAAKHELTEAESAVVRLEGRTISVGRAEIDELLAPIVARTTAPVRRALADAGISPAELDGVILVGGATRMPLVRRHCEELFGRKPLADIDPDQVVALGAAIQADLLAGEGRPDPGSPATEGRWGGWDVLLLDVNPLSLGIETMGGVVERIIARNSSIPTAAAQVFTTYAENQTGFKIHVVQGERELVDDCRSLARFELRGIPPMPAGVARLEVRFVIDANGLLRVTARELGTGIEQEVEVKPSYGLTDEEVERMLLESFEQGAADVGERLLREARVEADRILAAIRLALDRDADVVDDAEKVAIEEAIGALEAAKVSRDHHAIQERIEALDAASREFAGKIMNRSIAHALEGKSVDEVA